MIRFPQKPGPKDSQKWIQKLMNGKPEFLNSEIKNQLTLPVDQSINWLSSKAEDEFAECRDQAFLDLLDIKPRKIPLSNFWASRRPVSPLPTAV